MADPSDEDRPPALPDDAPSRAERDALLDLEHVIGHSIGYKLKDGKRTDEIVTRVYVDEKVDESDLDPSQRVPETFRGYPTDVIKREIEEDYFGMGSRDDTSNFADPHGGSNISTEDINTGNQKSAGSGSAAFVDRNDNGRRVGISNRHVLFDGDTETTEADAVGDAVYTPTRTRSAAYVGPIRDIHIPQDNNDVDAGSYYIDEEEGIDVTNHNFAFVPNYKPSTGWPDPKIGQRYMNVGARGYHEGVCVAIDGTISGTSDGYSYTYEQQVEIENYSYGGDSGSLTGLYDDDREEFIPVGLHWGSGNRSDPERISIMTPLNHVENVMGWDLRPYYDKTRGDYSVSTEAGTIEFCPYRTWDTETGTYMVRAVVINTGGSSKSMDVGLADVETNADGSTASINDQWLTNVTLDPAEWTHVDIEVPDTYAGDWTLRKIDDTEAYITDNNLQSTYSGDGFTPVDVTIQDEGAPENKSAISSGMTIGGFSVGRGQLGKTAYLRDAEGSYGAFVGTAAIAKDGERSAGGFFGSVQASSTRTISKPRVSAGEFGAFEAEATQQAEGVRSSSATFGAFQGSAGRAKAAERSSAGSFGSFDGEAVQYTQIHVTTDGTFRALQGEADRTTDGQRAATGSFSQFEGGADRAAVFPRSPKGSVGTFEGAATQKTYMAEDATGIFEGPFEGSAERVATFPRQPTGSFGAIEGTADVGYILFRKSDGRFGTFGTTTPGWIINGTEVDGFFSETRDWQELTLVFRSTANEVEDVFRDLKTSVGKFDVVERPGGGYKIVGRASKKNLVTLAPPTKRERLRTVREFVVESYDERQQDQHGDVFEVEVTFVATEPKEGGTDYGDRVADPDEWHFAFADGDIATKRVEKDIGRKGQTVDGSIELSMTLSQQETIVLEESLNRQAAVSVREIPDAEDVATDQNPDGRNTVTITIPSDAESEFPVDSGDYVVSNWETSLINDEFSQATMTVVPL